MGVKGMNELLKDLNRIERDFTNQINKTTNTVGNVLKADIKEVTPVDTGELRTSIVFRTTGKFEVTIGTTKKYAPHVNYGTKRFKGRYFLERGISNFEKYNLKPTLEHVFKKVFK